MEENMVYLVWYQRRPTERWALWGVYGNQAKAEEVLKEVREEYGYKAHINREIVWE